MAFDDAILGNDDFDPQAATDELLRRQMGDFPAGSDARGLNTRLLRKLGKAPAPEPASPSAPLARPKQPSPDTPLDLSGFEPVAPDAPATEQQQGQLDLSGFELVEPEKPKTTEQPSYIKEFVKGVAEGVKGMAASSVKGVAAVVPEAGAQPDYDPMGNAVGTNDAMEKGLTPKPMEERLFYRAGKRIDEFGKETLEAAPGFEGSWTRDIGAGFGSMLAGIPVALIPGVGPLVGGTLYTTAGMGEAVENAVKNKASTSQAESAGIAGSVAGATDLIDVMLPFFGGSAGRALGFIKRVGLAAVKGAVTEAGQEGIQQLMQNAIAMGVYKPDQDLFEDVPRSMAIAAIVGGTVAGGSAALHRDSATSSSPPPGPGAPGGAISGPAPGSGPGTPPPGGGRSSPEDIADFVRQANETNPNPPPGPGPTRPQDPATMTDVELMDAFMDIRPDMHGTLKDVLRRTGYADHTIDAMSHRAQVEEAIGVIRMERAEAAKNTQNPPNSEQPTGPQQEGLKPQPDLRHEEYAVLRAYGYTDEDIGSMSYVQRQREFLDAKDEGIDSTAAMKKYPPPVQPKEAEAGGATTSTAGTRAQPIVATTSEDVQKAQPVEPKSEAQAQAENYKHAHVELPVIGLEGKNSISVETGAGQTRSGTAPDGKQWKMVLKHAYGRIKGTKGADGQPLDIVIGPNPQSEHVFVVDQHEPGKGFDEHKIMAGFDTPQQAIVAYAGMYDDQGAGRIGGVKAFTPADFRAWLASGQTSTPLSPEPAAVKGESGATSSTEAGTFPVPKVSSEGVSEVSKDETTTNREGSSEKGVDILGPSPVVAEPSVDHHAQIEAVLGEDYHRVAEVDIQRAAEILAENEGMEPAIAFGQAVAENAVEQGFITEQEAVAAYGEEIQGVLDAGREGTPERGADAVGEGASPEQERAGGAEETGVVPGSSETGPAEDVAAVEAADRQDGEQHDAGRTEPDAERETSGAADEEASGPAEDADNASWWDGLNESDRANLKDSAGLPRKFDLTQPWSLLNSNIQEKLAAARPAFDKNKAAVEEGARDRKAKWSAAEQRASELVKRKDGESDKDYFARLIEASQADDAVPVYNAVRKALEPLMQVEELKPQRPASAKQIEGLRFEIGKTPIGYTTGADWAISGWMGRGGRATVFPDLLSDGEYGYFKTRDEALKHVVEKTIASFESVSKQVNDRVGTDAARRAAATTATFLKTWLTKNLTPPPSPSNSTPTPQPSAKAEAEAVGGKSTLDEAFQNHFATDHGFSGIIEARKFAKDKGFAEDAKSVEEALEFAIVKAARIEVEKGNTPQVTYERLVMLYGRQPRLGTRTSTSVRDQAYSTPVPLGYLAQRLAGITIDTTVYEPTAGNGALIFTADPAKVYANELNPGRAANLKAQGFKVTERNATDSAVVTDIKFAEENGVDVVITNPPFGVVKENGETMSFGMQALQPGYRTNEIDHAIALRSLDAMKDGGKAVLILGGINKMVTTREGRADAYNGKAKREFYLTLYNNYNVTDHFTVNGDLYDRQGAAWPVDVIVIQGRGKSARPLPAVEPPTIFNSWEALGGKLDGSQATGDVRPAGEPAGVTPESGAGLAGRGGGDRSGAGTEQPGPVEPTGVRGQRGTKAADTGPASGAESNVTERSGPGDEPARSGEQPAVDDFDAAFDAALDDAFGKKEEPAAPRQRKQPVFQKWEVVHDSGTVMNSGLRESQAKAFAKEAGDRVMARPERSTSTVAKDTVTTGVKAADEAFSALYDLFGGNKASSGFTFDEDTYRKAKPHFEAAASAFSQFKNNLGELLKRMVAHLRDAMKFTREAMERIKPYLKRFIDDMRAAETPEAPRKEALKGKPTETENQVVYKPRSQVAGLDTLAPVNMAKPMADSLEALEARVGPIDEFVTKELGFKPGELGNYIGAEQVDALGLAIDNIKRGRGFIIGDQTGIGKGRVNALVIRWAIKNGRMPVFVTEKPNLYKDMFRDLMDTGIADFLDAKPNILTTNASLNLPMEEGNGVVIKTGDPKAHNAFLSSQPSGYDMVFTTYNQMQTIKGEDTARRKYLSNLAGRPNGIVMIFDESHNAGGNKAKGKGGKEEATGRAGFSRELIQKANGVFYSSATYAKRPDVMDLYAATDMSMAVDDIGDLAEAISKGRVPMQQAVASMLARAGQYMRRERSFAGINYNTPAVNVDRQNYDNISKALAAIQDLSSYAKAAAKQITKELRASGEMVGADGATGDAGAKSTNFTAIMHNVINQMLLAMKAPEAAKRAIEAIKRGEKPVLTVANTMEAFLQDYSDQLEIKPGDEMPGDFSHVLRKYLDRTRTISIRKPFMAKGEKAIKHRLTDEELGFGGVAVYDRAMGIIDSMDLSGLPLSPIDFIKGELKKAGYETGEITGRTLAVDYTGKVPMLATRSGSEKTARGRAESIRKFNTKPKKGGVHAMIINQAGSTGLSLHASEKFDDQSRRRMLIVQPEGNIDTHMQLLGRINRTGQVVLPEYDQLVADIPAEKRPAAVLAKKMASLNANTTASRSSAVTAKDVPDFLNEYGDKIAAQWVSDNHDLHYRMASPVKISEEGKIDADDAMRALTGRLPLLQLAEQEAIYEELEGAYKSLIDQLEAAGENALEAKSLDLKGRLIEYMEVQGKRNDSGSPFAAPVVMQKVSIARLGKPFTPGQLLGKLAHAMDPEIKEQEDKAPIDMLANQLAAYDDPYNILGKKVLEREQAERSEAVKRFADYSRSIVDEEEDAEKQVKKKAEHLAVKDRFETIHQLVPIGKRVVLKTDTNNLSAIVLDVKQSGTPKNPLALGSWKVTFAIADASRQMVLPFSRLYPNGASNPDSALDVEVEPMTKWYEPYQATLERFQHMQNEAREERWIAGGNILAAYDWLNMKGAIINYTSYKGTVHQGILTARGFDPRKQAVEHGEIVRDAAKIKAALDDNPGHTRLYTKDGNLSIIRASRWQDQYTIAAEKSKAKGGAYFLDNDLTRIVGDFQSKGGMMLAYVNPDKLAAAISRIADISGGGFKMAAKNLEVTKVKPNEAVEPTETEGDEGPALAMVRPTGDLSLPPHDVNRLKALVTQAVEKMVGKAVTVEFSDTAMEMSADTAAKWNAADSKAVALYFPRLKLIEFALDSNLETNIPHEAYHASEYQLQTPVERELMQRETPRIRQLIRPYVKDKYRFGDAQIDKLADEEVRAIGMEAFMEGRLGGAHIGVRRWYQKLLDMLRRLANAIRGLGFQTAEDVYNALRSGEHAGRQEITPRPEASGPLAAIRPGGARPGPQPQNETIAEQLMNSGHDMLAGMSKKIGVGKFNTTEFRTKMQDKFIRIKRAEDSVGGVPSSLSAYQAESLYYGRTGERLERLQEDHIEPLLEAMHNADITPGELNEVLYALHAPARNAYIDTINPGLNGEGSGMSDAEAARILRSVPQNKRAELRAIIAMVRRMQSQTLDTLVAYGLISQDTADSWATQYPDGSYVPLRGFAEGSEDEELVGRGRGYDTRGKESKPAFGRKSEADGPLQYIIQQAMSAIVRGEKNRVSNTLYRFLRAHPDPDRWQINAPTIKRRIDARTGLVTHYADFNYHNEPDAVVTKIGGKPMVMRFYGKDGMNIARAVKQMGTSNLSGIMALLHTLTTLQSRLATQWNPNFMVPNFARDLGEAYINMQEQDQQHFIRQFTKHLMPAMKGAFQALNGAPNGSSPYVDAFREFDRAGGRVRFFGLSNPDDIKGKINSTMRRLQNGGFAKIENMALAVGHAFEVVNGSIENATRLAAYMAARDVGMTVPNSANLALNLTVNFTKRGEWGQGINALYMFGNASLQGTARLGRALQHERVRKAVYTLIAMGAAGALWNLMAGGDDDDGTPYYSKIKPYIRDKNLILMFPKGMGMDGKYIKVPLPYGFSPFHVLGDRAMGLVVGKEKFGQAAHSVLTSIADAFNPVGEESSLWMMMVPSVARPGFHIAFNKNWTGNPLYPEHDYDKHRPDSAKAFRSTSDFSKWGAKKLNELTGGSNYKAGWIDVHPGSLDHVIESVTGGLGKFVMDAAKTGYSVYKGDGFDATKAPIVRRFYGSAKDPIADAQAYYEARDEASKGGGQNLAAARKDASSGRNVESAREYLRENPKAAQGSEIFKRADEAMKPLRARLDRIEQDEQLTGEQKRRQRDEVVEQMRKVQNTARKRYRELKEGATP